MTKIEQAIIYATTWHEGQKRKGTDIPYILHPLKTMQCLIAMGADEDLVVAGLLHDVLEDTHVERETVQKIFGEKVAELVAAHSEDKSLPWKRRKEITIEECKRAPKAVRMLIMADTMANISDTVNDVEKFGDEVWKRFNTTEDKQAWYYWNKAIALESLCDEDESLFCHYEELCKMCYKVFGAPKVEWLVWND